MHRAEADNTGLAVASCCSPSRLCRPCRHPPRLLLQQLRSCSTRAPNAWRCCCFCGGAAALPAPATAGPCTPLHLYPPQLPAAAAPIIWLLSCFAAAPATEPAALPMRPIVAPALLPRAPTWPVAAVIPPVVVAAAAGPAAVLPDSSCRAPAATASISHGWLRANLQHSASLSRGGTCSGAMSRRTASAAGRQLLPRALPPHRLLRARAAPLAAAAAGLAAAASAFVAAAAAAPLTPAEPTSAAAAPQPACCCCCSGPPVVQQDACSPPAGFKDSGATGFSWRGLCR